MKTPWGKPRCYTSKGRVSRSAAQSCERDASGTFCYTSRQFHMKKKKGRRGRPPAGVRPGERVIDYPQLTMRVPSTTVDTLQAVCTVTGQPQWRVLADAVTRYIERLPDDHRQLLEALMQRSAAVFTQPAARRAAATTAPVTVLNVDDHEPM